MTTLTDQILSGGNVASSDNNQTLSDIVLTTPKENLPKAVDDFNIQNEAAKNRGSFVRGMTDILDTAAHGLGKATSFVADKVLPENLAFPVRQSVENMVSEDKNKRDAYDLSNPASEGTMPNSGETSRMAGQVAATLPLMPVRAFQAVRGALGALPTVSATGAKVAAPVLNRLVGSAATGGLSGAEFGGLTASTNENSTAENIGQGLITGAIVGPAVTAVGSAAKSVLPTVKNLWANVQISKLAQNAGMEPSAVKNVVEILDNAGFTPQSAQLALNKLGPNATLADLASSIQTEAGGLASFGGKPTEILKSRFEERAKTANSNASQIMETKLGPKPDIEAEKEKIINQVRKDVAPDYQAAKTTGHVLDLQPVADDIDKQLQSAVGPKEAALKQLKSFLYTNGKDTNGNNITILKHSAADLHEIRQAIDDVIEKRGTPETSYGKNALNAINDVRSGIDAELKTIPEMKAADQKFADKMGVVNHIDIGNNLLKNNGMNKEEFSRFYDSLTPDKQDAIKLGLRGQIGDLMEKATRGELSEAQRLFGKSSVNRANLTKVFGQDGSDVLDALEKEANMRSTERSILSRSHTAEGQAVQRKYGERDDKGGGLKDIVQGSVLDAVTGTPGAATAIMTAKRLGGHVGLNISEGRKNKLIEGTADLLSRQGKDADTAMDIASKIKFIQDKVKPKLNLSLPANLPTYLLSAPTGEMTYSSYKKQ